MALSEKELKDETQKLILENVDPKCRYWLRIQLFRERLSEKKCARGNPQKVKWYMINTLFLTL